MKPVITIAIALLLVASARAQTIRVETLDASANKYRFSLFPAPTITTTIEPGDPGWVYFWMFSDSTYSDQPSVVRHFKGGQSHEVSVALRGKYTNDQEPPVSRTTVTPVTPTFSPVKTLPSASTLPGEIRTQWRAARMGDLIHVALIVRNYNTQSTVSGHLKIRFPSDVFTYTGEVYTPDPAVFGTPSVSTYSPFAPYQEAVVREWTVTNLAPNSERAIFAVFRVNTESDIVRYGTQHRIEMDYLLQPTGAAPDQPGPDAIHPFAVFLSGMERNDAQAAMQLPPVQDPGGNDHREGGAPSPVTFSANAYTAIDLSFARDPNQITVVPYVIPPGKYSDPIDLKYEAEMENLGNAPAQTVVLTAHFDPRIDPNTISNELWERPSCDLPKEAGKECNIPAPVHETGNAVRWDVRNIGLFDFNASNPEYRRARFSFDVKTQPGLTLKKGDRISTRATVLMKNNLNVTEDSVVTAPAITYVEEECVPFGCILGAKYHNEAPGSAAPHGSGLSLTLRCPLYRPSGNSFADPFIRRFPRLFWQFELGGGASEFEHPSDGSVYKTAFVQVTPVQLRYMHPVNLSNWLRYVGVSAGYSAHIITGLKRNGSSVSIGSGLDKHLEHEFSASVDVLNKINVPGFSLGLGYKYRFNNIGGQHADYHFPFVSLQLDVMRFYQGFVQLWNKVL